MSKIEIAISEYEYLKKVETAAAEVYRNRDLQFPIDDTDEEEIKPIQFRGLISKLGFALKSKFEVNK